MMSLFEDTEENNKIFREFANLNAEDFNENEWNEKIEKTANQLNISVDDLLDAAEAYNIESEEMHRLADAAGYDYLGLAEDPVYGCDPYPEY